MVVIGLFRTSYRQHIISCVVLLMLASWYDAISAGQHASARWDDRSRYEVVTLLPVVYFDSASTDIPERYDIEPLPSGIRSAEFSSLYEVYLRILDALAEQLQQSSDHIYLHGYEERRDHIDACYFARRRAERIKNYLVFDRGIDARRIHILTSNANCVPPELTAQNLAKDNSEYRRVEILTSMHTPFPIRVAVPRSSRLGRLFASTKVISFAKRSAYITQAERRELRDFLATLPIGSQVVLRAYDDQRSTRNGHNAVISRRTSTMIGAIRSERKDLRIVIEAGNMHKTLPFDLPDIDRPEIRWMSRVVIIRRSEEGTR